jgi:hypothetical protein
MDFDLFLDLPPPKHDFGVVGNPVLNALDINGCVVTFQIIFRLSSCDESFFVKLLLCDL